MSPSTYAELRDQLRARLPGLAAGQRRIAELLLTDPEGTAFRSISQTAKLAGVHESSLVRFATALGLGGYPALVELCRQQLAEQAQLVRRFDQAEVRAGDLAGVVARDRANLDRTLALLDPADWERVVGLLAEAGSVHVLGLRKCFAPAYLLAYLLRLVRPGVRQLAAAAAALPDELRELAEGDVLVALSIHRYTADTVRAFAHARRRGLRTVALTDNPASPLAEYAEVTLYVETAGGTVLRSLTAFTTLVQALATEVALRSGTRTRAELLADEELLAEFDTYTP
ncbi:MurR/RpiR family transcriptional regulator [Amycolatopsis cihanbeyliensis]|uniref:RpiR family transcriptional regulator n=1 Tax=Amycolatopsis cihanbeyliensis TaxID=1128664 RepID=A0A542DID3_AMYCI|nr:MurR/RpiR family transcriptional regulator [Amycolatopsis cihanbeyliensis]TQJ02820.1 RpiR family transcriptional regulator [Amycolatopsis cihanbeyliensis]